MRTMSSVENSGSTKSQFNNVESLFKLIDYNCVSQRQNVKSKEYLEIAAFFALIYGRKCGKFQEVLHVQPSDLIL